MQCRRCMDDSGETLAGSAVSGAQRGRGAATALLLNKSRRETRGAIYHDAVLSFKGLKEILLLSRIIFKCFFPSTQFVTFLVVRDE